MKAFTGLVAVLFLITAYGCCIDKSCNPCPSSTSEKSPQEILRNTQFNHKTVVMLRMGMPLNEFENIFGPPDRSSSNTLEARAISAVKHMIYEYDMGKHADAPYPKVFGVNKFYFNVESDPPTLARWDLDYVY